MNITRNVYTELFMIKKVILCPRKYRIYSTLIGTRVISFVGYMTTALERNCARIESSAFSVDAVYKRIGAGFAGVPSDVFTYIDASY